MYSETDIDGAVSAGILSTDAAAAFRAHVAAAHAAPAVDEEHFRLLTGFNDIFVSIAVVLLLAALAQIGFSITPALGGGLVAAAAWGLALYFTAKRRMALPSIVLLAAFVGGIAAMLVGLVISTDIHPGDRTAALLAAAIGAISAGGAWLHWRRFMVPITVAAGALALAGAAIALIVAMIPGIAGVAYWLVLAAGLGIFALAMWWDMSDPDRTTRRSDVAFWLHLAAAPMIAHPVFHLLGVLGGVVTVPTAIAVLALYILFAIVALAIDRRALLVSSLVYVLYALYALFRSAGAVELSTAFTAFVIGSALLTLSAFWHPTRRWVVSLLGGIGTRLPPVQQPA